MSATTDKAIPTIDDLGITAINFTSSYYLNKYTFEL